MKIDNEFGNGYVIVRPKGDIRVDNYEILRGNMEKLYSGGHKRIVFDLSEVRFLDSMGLAELFFQPLKSAHFHNGQVAYINIHQRVLDLITLTKISQVVSVFPSLQEALKSFF